MDATLYKRLVDCNAEKSWNYVRDVVAVQLMGKFEIVSKERERERERERESETLFYRLIV